MAGSLSDYLEKKLLDTSTGKTAFTNVAPLYLALTTVTIVDADTGTTITSATFTGYARKSLAAADMDAASGTTATAANNAVQTFAYTSGTSTVTGIAMCDALTVGNMHWYDNFTGVVVDGTNNPPRCNVGGISLTMA